MYLNRRLLEKITEWIGFYHFAIPVTRKKSDMIFLTSQQWDKICDLLSKISDDDIITPEEFDFAERLRRTCVIRDNVLREMNPN